MSSILMAQFQAAFSEMIAWLTVFGLYGWFFLLPRVLVRRVKSLR
jgi:hypothetical protein